MLRLTDEGSTESIRRLVNRSRDSAMNLCMPPPQATLPAVASPADRTVPTAGPLDDRSLRALLDAIDYGTLLVDEALGLHWCNRIGQRWLGAGSSDLELKGMMLHGKDAAVDAALRRAVRLAIDRRVQSLVDLMDRSVAVVPLGMGSDRRLASLVVERAELCSHYTLAAFSRQHQLSPAEAGVLRLLVRGMAPEAIARRNGVALSTVRTQVISIRAKTGVASVRELVNRLSRIPPMVGVLDEESLTVLS